MASAADPSTPLPPEELSGDESSASFAPSVDSDDGNWEDWLDDEPPTRCLFCADIAASPAACVLHMAETHAFDLPGAARRLGDDLAVVRLVNWIRASGIAPEQANTPPQDIVSNEQYLKPVLDDDPLLYSLDLDDIADPSSSAPELDASIEPTSLPAALDELARLRAAFDAYRSDVQAAFSRSVLHAEPAALAAEAAAPPPQDEGDYYFNSYSTYAIHETMIKDRARTDAYRDFIYGNKQLFKDKVVLDVGCGTGILSMFCAKAGARRVFAVDASAIADKAREIVKLNGFDGIIQVFKGRIEDLELPEKVDVIVSEWMGYCLLYESMFDSVIFARDKWLKEDGLMAPSHATMFAALISDDMYAHDRMWWWDHVYGFDMSPLRPSVLADAQVDVVPSATISTVEREIAHWDLGKCTVDELDFSATVEWELLKAKRHHGLVIWFDTDFDHPTDPESVDAVILSTSPHAMETHWKQTVLLFPESLESIEGGNLKIELKVRKSKGNKRELVIEGHIMVEGAVEEPCKNDWKQVWFVQ